MNWSRSKISVFLAGTACGLGLCIFFMSGWLYLPVGKTYRMEIASLKNKVHELEMYKSDYHVLAEKYNVLNFQNISRKAQQKPDNSSLGRPCTEAGSLAGAETFTGPTEDGGYSIIIDRLVYIP